MSAAVEGGKKEGKKEEERRDRRGEWQDGGYHCARVAEATTEDM